MRRSNASWPNRTRTTPPPTPDSSSLCVSNAVQRVLRRRYPDKGHDPRPAAAVIRIRVSSFRLGCWAGQRGANGVQHPARIAQIQSGGVKHYPPRCDQIIEPAPIAAHL